MPATDTAKRPVVILALCFVLVCLIWGSTWIAIKLAVTDMPPLIASGLRFVVAAPVFLVMCRLKRVPLGYPRGIRWFSVIIFAFYFAIPFFLLNWGEQYISSGLAAICISSVAVLMVVFSVPILRTRTTPSQFASVLVAFAALGALIAHAQGIGVSNVWCVLAVISVAIMHALCYVMIKKFAGEVHALTLNTMPMAAAGIVLTGLGLLVERPGVDAFTLRSVGATLYLGVVASAIGVAGYMWLVQRMSTVTVSFVFVLFPIVAQLLAVGIEGTVFDAVDIVLTMLVLGAFAVTQLGQRRGDRRAPAQVPAIVDELPTEAALAEIYRHATLDYPAEACGMVRPSGVRPCVNVINELARERPDQFTRSAETGYAFGPADLRELAESFDSADPVRIIYHSHPDAGAYFSEEDQRHAVIDGYPTYPVRHLVVDVTADGAHGARLYEFRAEAGGYVECATFGNPGDRRHHIPAGEPLAAMTPGR